MKFGRNVVKEETTQKKNPTKMRKKSPQYIKINSQIKKPHLKMIPIKDKFMIIIFRKVKTSLDAMIFFFIHRIIFI